jgi:hypothetical protein
MIELRFPLVLALAALALPAACGGSSDPAPATVTVAPSSADLLTCSTTTFTATVSGAQNENVTWSVDPTPEGGSIDASGKYAAPIQVPKGGGGAIVTAATKEDPSVLGRASVTLATAHPKALSTVATSPVTGTGVWEHAIVGRGSRVYAVWTSHDQDGAGNFAYLARSDDGGKTWGAPAKINDNDGAYAIDCAAVAIDAADPDVVYVAYRIGVGGGYPTVAELTQSLGITSGSTLAFAVSKDQGATFTNHVLLSGPNGYGYCPDIASPSAGAVAVAAPANTLSTEDGPRLIDLYVDTQKGDGFAAGHGDMSLYTADELFTTLNNVGEGTLGAFFEVGENGGSDSVTESPRLFTDGKGTLCITYVGIYDGPQGTVRAYAQCSPDLGATFTAPIALDPGDGAGAAEPHHPTGTIGPNGEITIAWHQSTDASGSGASVYFVQAAKGGASFSAPVAVSTYAVPAGTAHAQHAALAWEGGILWLAYAVGDGVDTRLVIDKSCDGGTTWSGSQIAFGAEGALPALDLPGLFAAGDAGAMRMFALGTSEDAPYLNVVSLEP